MKQTILDFEAMIESVRKDGRIHNYKIQELKVYKDYLYYHRKYVDHKYHESVEYNLFPRENIGIYKLYQTTKLKYDPAEVYKYYVDMVSVSKEGRIWKAKDLYIDFIIKGDGRYYVVDIDEFNEAISRKELGENEIRDALNGLNNVLKGYYENNDLECYINSLREQYGGIGKLLMSRKTA
ncbi:MAG: DUF402 domain-containing protein [Clostridiaceae bacterium]|nr:DUF402 domain-containing protein [Clostridiaceae bacterium]